VGTDRRVDATPLVEDAHDRQLLRVQLALGTDHLAVAGLEPLGGVAAEVVDQCAEHAPIQSQGYDT
jgi:hypothetical protein